MSQNEKRGLRRNLDNLRPITLKKDDPAYDGIGTRIADSFASMRGPRPITISKDVKVFRWATLEIALAKLLRKYVGPCILYPSQPHYADRFFAICRHALPKLTSVSTDLAILLSVAPAHPYRGLLRPIIRRIISQYQNFLSPRQLIYQTQPVNLYQFRLVPIRIRIPTPRDRLRRPSCWTPV